MTSNSAISEIDNIGPFLESIKPQSPLKIVIFGPNKESSKIYKKRCEIKEKIKKLGHEAFFCEDILTPQILSNSGLNLSVAEFLIIEHCDYIVCLMESAGVIGEVHDFAKNSKIAHKMTICIDKQNQNGYSSKSVVRIFQGLNGHVDWFSNPEDIDHCHLTGRILEKIKCVAEAKQWEMVVGEKS